MLDFFARLAFPPKCIFCGELLNISAEPEICEKCHALVPFLEISGKGTGFLESGNPDWDCLVCVCEYAGIIKEALIRYKFFNKPAYYRAFSKMLEEKVKEMTNYHSFDIITSVPLHKNREKARGYNQSRLIGSMLSAGLGIREDPGLLIRVKDTESQSLLDREHRVANVKGAFSLAGGKIIKGLKVIIVDDVLTTGSTLNECCRVIKKAGAKEVVAAVIASGRKF